VNTQTGVVVLDAGDVGAIPTSEKGAASGVASLGADGVVPDAQSFPWQGFNLPVMGQFFGLDCAFATATLTTSRNMYHLIAFSEDTAVDRICIDIVNVGNSDGVVRLGLYGPINAPISNLNQVPLLFDAGTALINAIGSLQITIDQVIPRGVYFAAALINRGTANIQFTGTGAGSAARRNWLSLSIASQPRTEYNGVQGGAGSAGSPLSAFAGSIDINLSTNPSPSTFNSPYVYFRTKAT
jgi:hypothetical protein